jgi:hypothetical protein
MIAFAYKSRWQRLRRKPTMTAVVNAPNIPSELKPSNYWMGFMVYNDEATEMRKQRTLYAGVIASHADHNFLIRVPPPRDSKVPKDRMASS